MSELDTLLEEAEAGFRKQDHQVVLDKCTILTKKYPDDFRAWALRGASLLITKHYYPSIMNDDKALAIEPGLYQVYNNRGAAYVALNLFDEATQDLNHAIRLNPDAWEPHLQLGLMYGALDQYDASEYHLGEAAKRTDHHAAHAAYGTLLLGLGKWEKGFAEDLYRPEIMHQPFSAPHWKGEDLNHTRILLFSEGGQGDRILSLRYVNSILDKYSKVAITVRVPKGFERMVRSSFPVEVTQGDIACDYVCALPNVPMILGMSWDTVPRSERYLEVNQDLIDKWKPRVKELPDGLNVGLCWASLNGLAKVLPDKVIEQLCAMPKINFISLQKPQHTSTAKVSLLDWSDDIMDWADTAALVTNLDLVISVDTAVAHLAGALGKEVFNIVKYSTYWPWMDPRIPPSPRYSIWYPRMTLFRQQIEDNWAMPVSRIMLLIQRHLLGLT